MKKTFLFLLTIAMAAMACAQKNKPLLDFSGIEALKIGMSKQDIEKLINQKIVLKHIGIDVRHTETVNIRYNGMPFEVELMGSDEQSAIVESVTTTSPRYKTKEGIGIGSDLSAIINTYENQLLIITPDAVTLADLDQIRSSIVFTLHNKKVVKLSVAPTAAFRDRE